MLHGAGALDDLARLPRLQAAAAQEGEAAVGVGSGDHRQHADAHVERGLHLRQSIRPRRCTRSKIGCGRQVERSTSASTCGGSTRDRLPGMPPPVTCAYAWTSHSLIRSRHSLV